MDKASKYFDDLKKAVQIKLLEKYGRIGVEALYLYTPKDTGLTAASWSYVINKTSKGYRIDFVNSNVRRGVNIALILQFGHGTGTGGYVVGRDYINPALRPVFDQMALEVWREVTRL